MIWFLVPISAELRETAEGAQDWWGEAPDLPLRLSKAAKVVESVVARAAKPPSRGPACGISKGWKRSDRTIRSNSKLWMMAASWARLGSALTQNAKSCFNVAFPGKPPRLCRSLAPPILGPSELFPQLSAYGLKPRGYSVRPFHGQRIRGSPSTFRFHFSSTPSSYTSTLYLEDELVVICHAVLVLSENANIKRSRRRLKRKDVTKGAKRKSPLGLLTSNEPRPGKRGKDLQLRGNDRVRKARWAQGSVAAS
jgi:hypothetical protein